MFQSRQFALVCAHLGIRHLSARPYAPEGKGKVERFSGTVQRSFIPEVVRLKPKTLEELNEFFWAELESFTTTCMPRPAHLRPRASPKDPGRSAWLIL